MTETTLLPHVVTGNVLKEILTERARQDAKWGEQNHPDLWEVDEETKTVVRQYAAEVAQNFKDATYTDDEPIDWTSVLSEEFFETIAEADPQKIRAELIQVAAVAVAWIEAIDRRES